MATCMAMGQAAGTAAALCAAGGTVPRDVDVAGAAPRACAADGADVGALELAA